MKKIITIVAVIFGIGFLVRLCSPSTTTEVSETTKVDSTAKEAVPIDSSKIEPTTKWNYWDDVDKMTNKKNYFASIKADNTIEFDAPYNGGSVSTFTIRRMDGSLGSLLRVTPSQFSNADVYGGTVTIKFDEEVGRKYGYGLPSDGSSDVIFIENNKLLLSKLKKAKSMLIEAEFYNNGSKIMEFDVSNFEWNH